MKKQIILATAFFFLSTAMLPQVHAAVPTVDLNELKVLITYSQDPQVVEVHLSRLDKKFTTISLQDMSGKVWLTETVCRREAFEKRLNFADMPAGNYCLWISGQTGQHLQLIQVGPESVHLFEPANPKELENGTVLLTSTKKAAKTIGRITVGSGQSVQVQLANLKEHPTTVALHSIGAGPLLVQNIKGKQAYAKTFNLEGVTPGHYFLTVSTKEATICQFFTLSMDGVVFGPVQRLVEKATVLN